MFINGVNANRINIIFYANIIFMAVSIYHSFMEEVFFSCICCGIRIIKCILFVVNYFNAWEEQIEKMFYSDFMDALYSSRISDLINVNITPDTTQYEGSYAVSEMHLACSDWILMLSISQGKTNEFNGKEYSLQRKICIISNPTETKLYMMKMWYISCKQCIFQL